LLADREALFLRQGVVVIGTVRHIPDEDRLLLVIDLISTEALKTSEIEGESLDRDSVQSSLRRQFGLPGGGPRVAAAEHGISQMLADLYRCWHESLDDSMLFDWHTWRMNGHGVANDRRVPHACGPDANRVRPTGPAAGSL